MSVHKEELEQIYQEVLKIKMSKFIKIYKVKSI